MVCSFCRVNGHNKTNCNHPAVITVQKQYLYAISRMICSAYVRRITPLALKRELEDWLLVTTPLQHQKFIVGYLKSITRRQTVGNTESRIANTDNIINIMFHVCGINVQSVSGPISDRTNVFAFSPRSTEADGIPRLSPIDSPVTQSLFKEFLDATRFNTEIDNTRHWVEYSSNRWVVVSRQPHVRGANADISQQTIDIILPPSTAPPPPAGGYPRPLPTPPVTPYVYRQQLTPMPAVAPRPAVIVPAYRPIQVPRPVAARVDTQVVVKLVEYQVLKLDEEDCKDGGECPICYEDLTKETFVKLNCSHTFCKSCVKHCIERKMMTCSMCRGAITHIYTPIPVVQYSL